MFAPTPNKIASETVKRSIIKLIATSSFQIDTLQRSLTDARENSARLSSTIESLMTSHTELQEAMERLQTDTGQKESELNILRRDKYVFHVFYHLGEIKVLSKLLWRIWKRSFVANVRPSVRTNPS